MPDHEPQAQGEEERENVAKLTRDTEQAKSVATHTLGLNTEGVEHMVEKVAMNTTIPQTSESLVNRLSGAR